MVAVNGEQDFETGAPRLAGRERLFQLGRLYIKPLLLVLTGNAASAALAIVANWIVANHLGPARFGTFSLAMAVFTILQEVGGAALDVAIVRLAVPHMKDAARAEKYFRAGFLLKLIIGCGLGIALALTAGFLTEVVYQEPSLRISFYLMAAGLVLANISTIVLARLQAAERFVAYGIFRSLPNFVKVTTIVFAAAIGWLDLQTTVGLWMLSFLGPYLAGVVLMRSQVPTISWREKADAGFEILNFARWVMLSGLLFTLHLRADISLLGSFRPADEVGFYAIAWNLMFFVDLVTSSLVVALLPRAATAIDSQEIARTRRLTLLMAAIITMALSPMFFFADVLVSVLFPQYTAAVNPFRVLFISSVVVLLIFPLYLSFYSEKKPGRITFVYAVLALTSVLYGLLLIPDHGMMGAAYATLLARATAAAVLLAFLAFDALSRSLNSPDV